MFKICHKNWALDCYNESMSTKKKDSDICPRCGKPVDEHEAGRCLDAWFAEVVMGWRWFQRTSDPACVWLLPPDTPVDGAFGIVGPFLVLTEQPDWVTPDNINGRTHRMPHYSTDIAAAWEGPPRIKPLGNEAIKEFNWSIKDACGCVSDCGVWSDIDPEEIEILTLPPLAIVRACLKAKLAEKEADDEAPAKEAQAEPTDKAIKAATGAAQQSTEAAQTSPTKPAAPAAPEELGFAPERPEERGKVELADLPDKSLAEVRAIAKERGVTLRGLRSKASIIDAILGEVFEEDGQVKPLARLSAEITEPAQRALKRTPRKPPGFSVTERRAGSNRAGHHTDGDWVTDGKWMLKRSAHESLANIPEAEGQLPAKSFADTLPDADGALIDPDAVAFDYDVEPAYAFQAEFARVGILASNYNWITKQLGLRLAVPEAPGSPFGIVDAKGNLVGAVMPVEIRGATLYEIPPDLVKPKDAPPKKRLAAPEAKPKKKPKRPKRGARVWVQNDESSSADVQRGAWGTVIGRPHKDMWRVAYGGADGEIHHILVPRDELVKKGEPGAGVCGSRVLRRNERSVNDVFE